MKRVMVILHDIKRASALKVAVDRQRALMLLHKAWPCVPHHPRRADLGTVIALDPVAAHASRGRVRLWMPINILSEDSFESRGRVGAGPQDRGQVAPLFEGANDSRRAKKKATGTVARKLPDQGSNLEPSG